MSVNRNRAHVFVLPEDGDNRQLAIEFQAHLDLTRQRQMYVLDVADGWTRVLELFRSVHVTEMDRHPYRFMVLLFDFDGKANRLERAKSVIPEHLADRVFVLGAWNEPEDIKKEFGSYEVVGRALAEDCREGTDKSWGHQLLQHNATELDRLRQNVRPILFPD
jgi:hypothetical protein